MIEAALEAFTVLIDPLRLLYLVFGVAIGFTVGFLPGVGGPAAMALLLPLLFGMDPDAAMALMSRVLAVTNTSDPYTSVLSGILGTATLPENIRNGPPLASPGWAYRAHPASFRPSING